MATERQRPALRIPALSPICISGHSAALQMDLEQDDLCDEVIDVINGSEFVELSEGAQIAVV